MCEKILKDTYQNINTSEITSDFYLFFGLLIYFQWACNFLYSNFLFWGEGAQFDENKFFQPFSRSKHILFLEFLTLNFTVTLS